MIKLIAAISNNRVIGDGDQLAWSVPEDLKHFKETTINHSLLMGSKTYEGLPGALPNRTTYVLTRDVNKYKNNLKIIAIDDPIKLFDKFKKSKDLLFIAGGKTIYNQYWQFADELIITHINANYDGDVKWNEFDEIIKDFPVREEITWTKEFKIIKYNKK